MALELGEEEHQDMQCSASQTGQSTAVQGSVHVLQTDRLPVFR